MFHVKQLDKRETQIQPQRFPCGAAIVAENVGKGKGDLGKNSGKAGGILIK